MLARPWPEAVAPAAESDITAPEVRQYASEMDQRLAIDRLEAALLALVSALPGGPRACAVEAIGPADGLLPEEARHVAGAVPRRRAEFAAGRRAARRALRGVGGPAAAIPVGAFGQPLWPAGFDGSLTHDGRFAAALAYPWPGAGVAAALDLIDRADFADFAEIVPTIRHPDDPEPPAADGRGIARLFAGKEAAIKLLSPALGAFVDFKDLRARPTGDGFRIDCDRSAPIEVAIAEPDGMILALAWTGA